MSNQYQGQKRNESLLRSATHTHAQMDKLRCVRFSEVYHTRMGAILHCCGGSAPWRVGQDDAILQESFTAYCEEENSLPSAEALSRVTFSKAYEKRKQQILRAGGRPPELKAVRGKRVRRVLRVGIVAALLAVIVMSNVFSNPNGVQNMAGFEINMDSYFGTIESPTNPDGTYKQDPSQTYIEQPDGTYRLPERYAPTYIPADYPLEDYSCDGRECYIFRKDNAFLFWPGDYITFDQDYPGSTHVFNVEDYTLEEIEVEGLGKCLYHAAKKGDHRSLYWRNGPYLMSVHVSDLSKDELIKIVKSTKLIQN